ncbi:MAG: hypothetical protein JW750_12570 [Anaerolineaceae bacterium]|nr:hypothetical protein [Anaerolineaceae bacterium]
MTSKVLDPKQQPALQPQHALWALYHPESAPFHFDASTPEAAEVWRERTRAALFEALGFKHLPEVPFAPEKIESVDKGSYIREKWIIHTWENCLMPFYLLIPKGIEQPYPTVLALHGHGYGVKDIVGLWEDGGERNDHSDYHRDFGVALCEAGFLVAAPEISCFGERQSDLNKVAGEISTCQHTSFLANYLGGTTLGLRVHDAMRLIDYLETLGIVDMERLGAMGISGGGMHTFFSTALDLRIRACVISGYYSTFRDSILGMNHCSCNYVPGLWQFGEMYDLIGLIAPRPVLVESGDHDPIFPREAVVRSVEIARNSVYSVWDASDQFETDYFEGRHRINGARAYDFLKQKLA